MVPITSRAIITLIAAAIMGCGVASNTPRAAAVDSAPFVRGQVDTFSIATPGLATESRTIRVYTPPGYRSDGRSWPVLYMHDAQNLFEPGTYGDWLMDETLDSLAASRAFDGLIVVGVDNSRHRIDEYSPWVTRHLRQWVDTALVRPTAGGGGGAYVEFIVGTLKPEIDRRYRTLPGREHTGIGGSSLGALISLHAGLDHSDVFSKVMAMSTAVMFTEGGGPWLSRNQLLERLRQGTVPRNVRYYLDVGGNERSRDSEPDVVDSAGTAMTYPRAYVEGSQAVAAALARSGVPADNIRLVVEPDAPHHESAWARRFGPAVMWLYR